MAAWNSSSSKKPAVHKRPNSARCSTKAFRRCATESGLLAAAAGCATPRERTGIRAPGCVAAKGAPSRQNRVPNRKPEKCYFDRCRAGGTIIPARRCARRRHSLRKTCKTWHPERRFPIKKFLYLTSTSCRFFLRSAYVLHNVLHGPLSRERRGGQRGYAVSRTWRTRQPQRDL